MTSVPPYLLYASSHLLPPPAPQLDEPTFSRWYSAIHIPSLLASTPAGSVPSATRYKRVAPPGPGIKETDDYLALYTLTDARVLETDRFATGLRFDGGDIIAGVNGREDLEARVGFDVRMYELVQAFEVAGEGVGVQKAETNTVIVAAIEPAAGPAAATEFDRWYRESHIPDLAKTPSYLRTNRYKLIPSPLTKYSTDETAPPTYLALHEYSCGPAEVPAREIEATTKTVWAQKILGEIRAFEGGVYGVTERAGGNVGGAGGQGAQLGWGEEKATG
ncbi:MAG: hypothetical protein M1819_002530 [Sarea resinae]|nr:MAG: hypothetical protein M1819_002530 [Sarea resinae]